MTLSLSAARNIHLAAQGLLTAPKRRAKKEDVLTTIHNMGLLQIDTIHVVARSPYLVLWSRLGEYQNDWLDQHLAEGQLFEYWSHEACFLPISSFERYRQQMLAPQGLGWKYNERWLNDNRQHVDQILKHIKLHGACRSADFERQDGKGGGWWEWKPEKRSLEVLFTLGKVMVARRERFQRVYDLTERVHPTWNDKRDLRPLAQTQTAQVLDAVRALGICKASWIADYYRMKKLEGALRPEQLAAQGLLRSIEVEGWKEMGYYHPDQQSLIDKASAGQLRATHSSILSPFDPVVWDRKRAAELFDFDYKLECYTPEAKRQFGYFCLPILRRGKLIGRLDAKAHRKQGIMEIKSLYFEDGVEISEAVIKDLAKTLKSFADWHQTPEVKIGTCKEKAAKKSLLAHLAALA